MGFKPKFWAEIKVKVPPSAREAVVGFLLGQGMEQFQENEEIILYLPFDRQVSPFLSRLCKFLSKREIYLEEMEWGLSFRIVEERDWGKEWQKAFRVRKVGERLVIKPSWQDYQPREGEVVLEIDPGMSFGTGEHPTTRLMLVLLQRYLKKGDVVIDVGCGSGILSLASLLLGAERAIGIDVDERAVEESRRNAKNLSLSERAEFKRGDLLKDLQPLKANIVLCNIDLPSLQTLFSTLPSFLEEGGYLIGSGFTGEGAEILNPPSYLEEVERREEEGWVGIVWRMR